MVQFADNINCDCGGCRSWRAAASYKGGKKMYYSGDEYYSEDVAADMTPKKRVRKFYGTAPRNRYGAVAASGPQGEQYEGCNK